MRTGHVKLPEFDKRTFVEVKLILDSHSNWNPICRKVRTLRPEMQHDDDSPHRLHPAPFAVHGTS
jgi:hypothetical protein